MQRQRAKGMDTKQRIRDFVKSNFFVLDGETLTDSASLLDIGVVDSTGVLEIIGFLESTFGLILDSIERIAAFVGRKQAAAGA